jgi:glycosyltransferase involved in cell wall biosynthesis
MSTSLLSILIPTYNRAHCLSLLLETLTLELQEVSDKVTIIIGNNASTDETSIIIDAFSTKFPTSKILHHSCNLGPDENFCQCIDQVTSRFFWIIGDDDLPKVGLIRQIVNLLEQKNYDLLYLNSEWLPNITSANDGTPMGVLVSKAISREDFAQQVNVWVTFISGMVVNLDRLYELNPGLNLRRFTKTSLVQLGWVLPLLVTGSRFCVINQRCILATGGNTGGYKLLMVFSTNFPAILSTVCGSSSKVSRSIVARLVWTYIPALLWTLRFRNNLAFTTENMLDSLRPLRGTLGYWLMLLPLVKFPKLLGLPFFVLSKVLARLH